MRESMRDMLSDAGEVKGARLIANNTVEYYRPDGTRVIRLHHTDILEFKGKNVTLNSGGWKTVTTKDRLNHYGPASIWSERGIWYVAMQDGDKFPFYDGMTIRNGILPRIKPAIAKREAKLGQEIAKFARQINTMETLPVPGVGDCWFCCMRDKDGKSWGDSSGDTTHLAEHVRENYLHGSLIVNAMRWAGYSDQGITLHYRMGVRRTIASAVRRYLRRQLGLST